MEIKNVNLNRLIKGLEQIGQLEITDFQLNYYISRNMDKLSSLWKSYTKSLSALINQHVKMSEEGTPVINGEDYSFKSKKDRELYIDKKTKLDEFVTEVKIFYLKTSALEGIKGLNGVMLFLLGELIVDDKNILGDDTKVDEKKTT